MLHSNITRYDPSPLAPPVSPAGDGKRFNNWTLPQFLPSWTSSPGALETPFASAPPPSAGQLPCALPSVLQALFLPQTVLHVPLQQFMPY